MQSLKGEKCVWNLGSQVTRRTICWGGVMCLCVGRLAFAGETVHKRTSLRTGWGQTVTAVEWTPPADGRNAMLFGPRALPHAQPRLAGYSPLVAVATSDQRKPPGAMNVEHVVHGSYVGNPLPTPLDHNIAFGILDTGADMDLFAGQSAVALGLYGDRLTPNCVLLGGVGSTIEACISYPVGVFAAGLSAVDTGGTLDLGAVVGHSNVAVLVAPEILCGDEELLTGVIGMPFVAFFNSIIRVDNAVTASIGGVERTSPDVEIREKSDPLPGLARKVLLEFASPEPVISASYFPDLFDPAFAPIFPTELSGGNLTLPSGGSLLTEISARNGGNPEMPLRMLFDTAAQISAITPAGVVRLNLPNEPDFSVTLCGIGGSPGRFGVLRRLRSDERPRWSTGVFAGAVLGSVRWIARRGPFGRHLGHKLLLGSQHDRGTVCIG